MKFLILLSLVILTPACCSTRLDEGPPPASSAAPSASGDEWPEAHETTEPPSVEIARDRGTPQGGVISPILSNLFLHYAFDVWMERTHSDLPWCRYADDGLVHCRTEQEAEAVKAALQARLAECGLEMHPTKSRIVYCKDGKRKGRYPNVTFDFLGYQFRPRMVQTAQDGSLFCSFVPAVSPAALKSMRSTIRPSARKSTWSA